VLERGDEGDRTNRRKEMEEAKNSTSSRGRERDNDLVEDDGGVFFFWFFQTHLELIPPALPLS
jgi:hypothetical protein